MRIEASELSGAANRFGIEAGLIGFDAAVVSGRPRIALVDTVIRGNASGGISMNAGGALHMQGGSVTMNGAAAVGAGSATGYGGIYLSGAFAYTVVLRGVNISDNALFPGYGGVDLAGDASSSFDLGTASSPGDNTLSGNGAPQLRLRVASDVLVSAVGNTWLPDQGADSQARYSTASALCMNANPCDLTEGSGPNFVLSAAGAGARLRLAAQ